MHRLGGMINESPGLPLAQPGLMAFRDEGNANAMRTGSDTLSQKEVEAGIFLSCEVNRAFCSGIAESEQQWLQFSMQGDRKVLARVLFLPFHVHHCEPISLKVDSAKLDGRFTEATAGKKHDFEDVVHPCRLSTQFLPYLHYVGIRKRLLSFLRSEGKFEALKWISVCGLAPNCFGHNVTEELHFKPRCVVAGLTSIDRITYAPVHVFLRVLISDLARKKQLPWVEKGCDRMPSNFNPSQSPWALFGITRNQVARHPTSEITPPLVTQSLLRKRRLLGHTLRPAGVRRIVGPKAGRSGVPLAIPMPSSQVPKRRPVASLNVSHVRKSHMLSHDCQDLTWLSREWPWRSWRLHEQPNPTVTLRGKLTTSASTGKASSLPSVSHLPPSFGAILHEPTATIGGAQ